MPSTISIVSRPICRCMAGKRAPRAGFSDRLSTDPTMRICPYLKDKLLRNTIINTPVNVKDIVRQDHDLELRSSVCRCSQALLQIIFDLIGSLRLPRCWKAGDGDE